MPILKKKSEKKIYRIRDIHMDNFRGLLGIRGMNKVSKCMDKGVVWSVVQPCRENGE